jgi:hypothetical protein
MEVYVTHSTDEKELDRRHFLRCMAWVGTGALWTMAGGVAKGSPLGPINHTSPQSSRRRTAGLRFVQISDSHIGFDKGANSDVTRRLREAVARIKAEPEQPSIILHTAISRTCRSRRSSTPCSR